MSFRTEDKYIIYDHTQDIMHYLLGKGGKFLFPARKIISIYFDNENLEMFYDSEEGVVPRKKVRVRYYNNQNENSLGLCKLSILLSIPTTLRSNSMYLDISPPLPDPKSRSLLSFVVATLFFIIVFLTISL